MTAILLALLPLAFALGFLTWTMLMGSREQKRSDLWAESWVRERDAAAPAPAPHA
jgi:hypothetical protein